MKQAAFVILVVAAYAVMAPSGGRAFVPARGAASAPEETAAESPQAEGTLTAADTTAPYPDKMAAKSGWEYAVSAPGYIVYIPFWLVAKSVEGVIYVAEKKPPILKWARVFYYADGSRGLYPTFEPRYGAGLLFFQKRWPNSTARFDVSTMWGLRGRQRHRVRHRYIGVFSDFMKFSYRLRYQNLPDERFFGIGPDTSEEDESQYGHKMALGEITLGKRFFENLQVDVIAAMEHNIIADGNNPDGTPVISDVDPTLTGLGEELTLVRFGFGLDLDARNQAFRPSSGTELTARGGWIQDGTDTDFGLSVAHVDASFYFSAGRRRVVILRGAGTFTDPLPGRETPFYWLPQLGRLETMRGMTRGRFRDNDLVVASLEYRWEISTFGDALLFVDTGQVSPNVFNEFRVDDLQWAFGGGYRVWLPDGRTGLRAELGVSEERIRFHFVINSQ